jgi:hypothetical protein
MTGFQRMAMWLRRLAGWGLLFAVAYLALLPVYAAVPRLVMASLLALAGWWLLQTAWATD